MKTQIRVALTGAHGTGKTTIVELLRNELHSQGYSVSIIGGTTRAVLDVVNEDDWRVELLSSAYRYMQELELAKQSNADVILSERMGLDEVAYATFKGREKHIVKTLQDIAEQETLDFWDAVFYKPIHPDYELVNDGVRPTDPKIQKQIDKLVVRGFEKLDGQKTAVAEIDIYDAVSQIVNGIYQGLSIRDSEDL